jgi:dTDP-glucose 4,6-dehydratase
MKKNILITGAAGFIGSSFAELALKSGYKVIVLDLITYAGDLENLNFAKDNVNFKFEIGDIGDEKKVSKLLEDHKIDFVVNFAAESHVDNSILAPDVFIQTNIVGAYNLLKCSLNYYQSLKEDKKQNFRYIQISTDEVFGSLGDVGKFHEEYPYQPNSPYSASKAAADHLTRAWYETYGLPTIVTNCSNNYGPRQFPEKLIPKIITNALNEKSLPIYGDGKNIRDWIHVEDHCKGVMLALTKGIKGESYCFGGRSEETNLGVVTIICNILDELKPRINGKKYHELITMVEDRLGHDRRYAIDDTKSENQLGFERDYNFMSGIKSTINWYLNNQEWCEKIMVKK